MKYIITETQYNYIKEQWYNDPNHPEYKQYAPTDYEKRDQKKSEDLAQKLQSISPHTLMTIAGIGTAFIPFIGPFISAGIGLADAALYYNEGDKKTAGLVAVFAMIPGVGGLASKLGLTKWTAKALGEIGKKISLGLKLAPNEIQVANRVAQYRQLIQSEMTKFGKSAIAQTAKGVGKQLVGYGAVGAAYNKGYDKIYGNTFNPNSIDTKEISQTNKTAAQNIKFD